MIKHLVVLILLIPFNCYALSHEKFSTGDIIRQSAFTILTAIDWKQTKDFRKRGISELNPILGEYPTQTEVDTLIFGGIVSHYLISYFLSSKYREIWQYFFILTEMEVIAHNHSIMNTHTGIQIYTHRKSSINITISF